MRETASVRINRQRSMESSRAREVPTRTGAIAAVRVRGRLPLIQVFSIALLG